MALSPDDKFLFLNTDTAAGESDGAMYYPIRYLRGLQCEADGTASFYFRGPNDTISTRFIIATTAGFIKEFFVQFVNEINFGEKAAITLAVKNLSVSTTDGGSDFVYVNATVGAIIQNDDLLAFKDLQVAEDLDVGGTISATELNLIDNLAVQNGGTSVSSLTDNGVLFGNGTAAISAVDLSASGNVIVGGATPAVVTGANLAGAGLAATVGDGTLVLAVETLNQDTTGSAATLTTPRAINGVDFDGSAAITVTAAGSTLSDTVTVAKGGTGLTTVGTNEILTGNGTGALTSEANLTFGLDRLIIGANAEITPNLRLRNDENTVDIGVSDAADNLMSGSADGDFVINSTGDHNLLFGQNNAIAAKIDTDSNFNLNRRFTVTGNTDGTYEGDVVYFGGTTSMTVGTIYHYKSDGTWEVANANAVATSDGLLGVALGAASDTNGMLLRGMVTLDHDPGAVGDVLYLSNTNGDASSTAPSDNNDIVRVIGYCLHASNGAIWFNPDSTFVEVTA